MPFIDVGLVHSEEFVNGDIHTNTIKCFWSYLFKN